MKYTIRLAGSEDKDSVISIARQMITETKVYDVFTLDETKIERMFYHWIENPDALILILESDGVVIGGFIGEIFTPFYSDEKMAVDHIWYVHPDHRKSSAGMTLMKMYRDWAKLNGVKLINAAVTFGYEKESIDIVLNRFGFKHIGYQYVMKGE